MITSNFEITLILSVFVQRKPYANLNINLFKPDSTDNEDNEDSEDNEESADNADSTSSQGETHL